MEAITGVILAGGKSRRMGKDKALIPVGGIPVIKRIIYVFNEIFKDIFIVSDRGNRYRDLGYREVADLIPHKGPLGGIYTALYYATTDLIFVTSCDMPFISGKVIRFIIEKGIKDKYDMVIPEVDGRLHPLHGLYRKTCMTHILEKIKTGVLDLHSVIKGAKGLHVRVVSREEIIPFDPSMTSFFNMNTMEDLIKAQSIEKGGGKYETR